MVKSQVQCLSSSLPFNRFRLIGDVRRLTVKKKRPVEIHNYPKESIIQYSDSEQSYTYNIIKEETYLPAAYLKYTKGQKGF
ncbi:hypothetical protein RhiirB3_523427 [Rhizophagus irregularis]|nr:hypothetical protein RhiirB3_523427 [Rhizophagus irregularis]